MQGCSQGRVLPFPPLPPAAPPPLLSPRPRPHPSPPAAHAPKPPLPTFLSIPLKIFKKNVMNYDFLI